MKTDATQVRKRPVPYVKKFLSGWAEALLPVAAVALALLVGAGMLVALKADPLKAYSAMLQGAAGNVSGITQTLDNFPGFDEGIAGAEFADRLTKQARRFRSSSWYRALS